MKRLLHGLLIFFMVPTALTLTVGTVMAEEVFVKAAQVAELVKADVPKLRIIDCRVNEDDYNNGHIPGAVYLNVRKDLRVKGAWDTVGVRRQLEEQEELFGRQLGIDAETMVVLYDDSGWDATRLFWELKYTGHDQVAIIDGGWPEWNAQELPVSTDIPTVDPALFVADVQPQLLATASYIMSKMGNPNTVLLDARPPAQFSGEAKHKAALSGGRLPGAVNAFTLANWNNDTYLKNTEELMEMYEKLGVTPDKEVIVYCNTGYFASNTYFILKALQFPDVSVYDYSWVEWSGKGFLPKVAGNPQ